MQNKSRLAWALQKPVEFATLLGSELLCGAHSGGVGVFKMGE